MNKKICIIGGGIAGIQCALDLSEAGQGVIILEKGDAAGGVAALLDKTFPTNDCSMCTLAPKLIELARRPTVEIVTRVEIEDIQFNSDDVTVAITINPRFVDEKKCIVCGKCEEICPIIVTSPTKTIGEPKKAISRPFPQAIPNAYAIDPAKCLYFELGQCKKCQEICPTKAINLDQTRVGTKIRATALVIATGARPYDPSPLKSLGYGRIPNVITNLELEQMMKATGPTKGHILRPSDNTPPKSIAWVQCAGSRTLAPVNRPFCSSTCCMSSIKEAFNALDKCHNIETEIFFIDIRAHQKGSERYYRTARERGVNFIRCRISELLGAPDHRVIIRYRVPGGAIEQKAYDLVVLSVGRSPGYAARLAPHKAQVLYNEFGFVVPAGEENFKTLLPRVYACGAATSPKSIPHSIIEGSAAAGAIVTDMSLKSDIKKERTLNQPGPRPIFHNRRIGVFICGCGGNISDSLDLRALALDLKAVEGIGHVEILDFACGKIGISKMKKAIKKMRLDGVVIAACSPLTHEAVFQDALYPLLPSWAVTMANIRNQNAWAHKSAPILAHEKAKDQIRLEATKLLSTKGYWRKPYPVTKRALILGGGMSGMRCALDLARLEIPVTLVERSSQLGGNARVVQTTWRGTPLSVKTAEIRKEVESHPLITVLKNAKIEEHTGRAGSFTSKISLKDGKRVIVTHGVTIVAIGAKELRPNEYLYGHSPRVLTHLDLDRLMMDGAKAARERISASKCVAFIQCVGSREPDRPYCSRVCCTHTIKRALLLKNYNPDLEIIVFYRQLRTYGLKDQLLLEARTKGIKFVHYEEDKKPLVEEVLTMDQASHICNRLKLTFWDATLKCYTAIYPDYLILASAIVPDHKGYEEIASTLGIPLDEDGFFQEAHLKLRPVETIQSGVFLAGLCQYPKEFDETVSQCSAVISRAYASILSKENILLSSPVATIDLSRCDGCGVCIEPCPFRAIRPVEYMFKDEVKKAVEIEEANCTGCGICVATCPKEAVEVAGFEPSTIISQIDAIWNGHE